MPGSRCLCQRLGYHYLLVLMNTEVFFILLKKSLLHIPWVSGVNAHVTTTKSDSSASLVSGTEWRNKGHSSCQRLHQALSATLLIHKNHQQASLSWEKRCQPFSTEAETQGWANSKRTTQRYIPTDTIVVFGFTFIL